MSWGREKVVVFVRDVVGELSQGEQEHPSFPPTLIYDLINSVKLEPAENYCSFKPSSHHH